MYLKSFEIKDIKCFREPVKFDFLDALGNVKKWNVIVGENGTGKSTLLRAIAVSLIDIDLANRLQRPENWVRTGCDTGRLKTKVLPGRTDRLTDEDRQVVSEYEISSVITGDTTVKVRGLIRDRPMIIFDGEQEQLNDLRRGPWSRKPTGWFSAGYGPFRRLGGGSGKSRESEQSEEEGIRFLTLFSEDAALVQLENWLKDLDYRVRSPQGDPGGRAQRTVDMIKAVTRRLFPEGVSLARISPDGVFFRTPYSTETPMLSLSDGYRGMLALAIDLLRGLSETFHHPDNWSDSTGTIVAEGVVLIDELDAHLHPRWQREIGLWLQKAFPRLQFIVATHSPFVAQAADRNAIFVLDRAGPDADYVTISDAPASVLGWSAEQVLNILFDASGRDPTTDFHMRRYDQLQARAASQTLSVNDRANLDESKAWLDKHLSAPGSTLSEMEEYDEKRRRADDLARRLKEQDTDA